MQGYNAKHQKTPIRLNLTISLLQHATIQSRSYQQAPQRIHRIDFTPKRKYEYRHAANNSIQPQVSLVQRRPHPPANKQPTHERIQRPPVRSNDVQKDSTIGGHHSYSLTTRAHQQHAPHSPAGESSLSSDDSASG